MKVRTFASLLGETAQYIKDDTVQLPTGFPTLDKLLHGGFRPGHVAMLLGRTGVGKTLVSTQIAVNAASAGWPVLYASLEMGREEMVVRALSAETGLSNAEVQDFLTDKPLELDTAVKSLSTLSIDDSTKPTWADLSRWVAESERWSKGRTPLVVLDHLALMARYGYPRGETERIGQLSEDAKAFAKESGVALLVIHQVGRFGDGDARNHGHLPLRMENAKYGGEQDMDYILGVYRPDRDPELSETERREQLGTMFLQVLKNRHGMDAFDGVPLYWHIKSDSMRIEENHKTPEATYIG